MRQKAIFYKGFTVLVKLPKAISNMTSSKPSVFLHNMHFKGIKKGDT